MQNSGQDPEPGTSDVTVNGVAGVFGNTRGDHTTRPGNYQDFAFPSSGDAAEDQRIADAYILHDRRIAECLCPNGCGPMIALSQGEQKCPKCPFHYQVVDIAG